MHINLYDSTRNIITIYIVTLYYLNNYYNGVHYTLHYIFYFQFPEEYKIFTCVIDIGERITFITTLTRLKFTFNTYGVLHCELYTL